MKQNNAATWGYTVGQRVEISPAYDAWMQGARYGEIVKITRKALTVKLDARNKPLRVTRPSGIYGIIQ